MKIHNLLASLALASSLVAITACSKEEKPADVTPPADATPPATPPPATPPPASPTGAADIKPEDADKVAADLEKEIEADSADEDKQ